MNDILIWFLIFLVLIIILGIHFSQDTPLNLNEKNFILNEKNTIENFNPLVSSTNDVSEGASELYNWGLPKDRIKTKKCSTPTPDPIPPFKPYPVKECIKKDPCCDDNDDDNKNASYPGCFNCDITKNKDINKYVLKSSVPACPDTSKYATKNMVQACPDINNYILKSHIPSCPKVDLSQYILKSEIASCPKCPICPVCPICPTCPPQKRCKTIKNYSITEHPDFKNYIHKDDLKKQCALLEEEEGLYPSDNNNNNNNNKNKKNNNNNNNNNDRNNRNDRNDRNDNNCNKYPPIVDRVFDKKYIKPFSNPEGMYVGDNLFAAV